MLRIVEHGSTLSNKFWFCCSFFIKLTTGHATISQQVEGCCISYFAVFRGVLSHAIYNGHITTTVVIFIWNSSGYCCIISMVTSCYKSGLANLGPFHVRAWAVNGTPPPFLAYCNFLLLLPSELHGLHARMRVSGLGAWGVQMSVVS